MEDANGIVVRKHGDKIIPWSIWERGANMAYWPKTIKEAKQVFIECVRKEQP